MRRLLYFKCLPNASMAQLLARRGVLLLLKMPTRASPRA